MLVLAFYSYEVMETPRIEACGIGSVNTVTVM